MYRALMLIVLAGCGRPVDEDCWRGPVPVVRECPCSCDAESGAPPGDASASPPPQGGPDRDPLASGALGISTAPFVAPLRRAPPWGRSPGGGEGGAPDPISLRITQAMIDPTNLPDRDGEWVEVHNPTPLPADLRDVEVAVNGATRCVLSDTTIPAFGYLLVARTDRGGRRPCSGLSLPNRRGELALVRCGEVLDVMVWERAPKGAPISASRPPRRSSPRPPG